MSFSNKPFAGIVAVAVIALTFVAVVPGGAQSSDYCRTEAGLQDPRCKPDFCQTPQGQRDPYCVDPHYCEKYPNDPICAKGPTNEEKKQHCTWSVDGAPVGSLVPILRQSNPGPHAVRLECPNHAMKDWACKAKSRDQTPIPTTGQEEPTCTYHGATVDPSDCSATFLWTVVVPDFNTWTVELSATTYKVVSKPDPTGLLGGCYGPVDWNTTTFEVAPDGTLVKRCVLENEFMAKDMVWKQNGTWYHYERSPTGEYTWHTHPNAASKPDGKIDECDLQSYSIQWRQWN